MGARNLFLVTLLTHCVVVQTALHVCKWAYVSAPLATLCPKRILRHCWCSVCFLFVVFWMLADKNWHCLFGEWRHNDCKLLVIDCRCIKKNIYSCLSQTEDRFILLYRRIIEVLEGKYTLVSAHWVWCQFGEVNSWPDSEWLEGPCFWMVSWLQVTGARNQNSGDCDWVIVVAGDWNESLTIILYYIILCYYFGSSISWHVFNYNIIMQYL